MRKKKENTHTYTHIMINFLHSLQVIIGEFRAMIAARWVITHAPVSCVTQITFYWPITRRGPDGIYTTRRQIFNNQAASPIYGEAFSPGIPRSGDSDRGVPGNYAISIIIRAAINELAALNAGLTFISHESLGSRTSASIRERAIRIYIPQILSPCPTYR